ncbi:MAG TPA: FAD-dependent monooxygenase [Herpetosiphonaceae bacterium]|nr:FAD-dependent monooxygenase [Herpetosiphonaceae bacterium]
MNHPTVRLPAEMRVLIVGGGIAGLTLGALLKQQGMRPEIVERTHRYGGVGYVLSLWPAGADILKGLGLYPALAAAGLPGANFEICGQGGRLLHRSSFAGVEERFGSAFLIERSRLLEILRAGADGLGLRMGVSVDGLDQRGDEVRVAFSDGTHGTYDLVVGADGLRSRVRELIFGPVRPRYMGLTGWAFWLPPALLPEGTVREYWGAGRFVGLYPAPGALCGFVAAPAPEGTPDPAEGRLARLRATFARFGGVVPEALAALDDPRRIWHDDFLDLRMPTWHRGRVVLLGDSAHAMLPTAGIGASMAMESAAVLADELARTDSRYVGRALERFHARRKPRVDKVQRESRLLGKTIEMTSPAAVAIRDALMRRAPQATLSRAFARLLQGPI